MGVSIIGATIGLLIVLPSMIFFTLFPPKNPPAGLKEAPALFTGLERLGQVGCLVSLVIAKDNFRLENLNLWAALMLVCILIYYGLWLRYIVTGQQYASLWEPWLFIPIPLALFPVLAFGFAAAWGRWIWLGVATALLAVGHLAVSWHSYVQSRQTRVGA